ncbi:uncharacterized protein FMAN_14176 [Fusarium mangiferae]|uniref:Homeobox domain-containing protein n=1 Tax=Fusarium mangiferae TaxID=192010 RepID=A0A1L7UG44_FUSMA|nr:uncharacterized protein FMAN_14176 [Fusarium mangiferae]CVL08172.1 uncharacterized protein FMAN_14176 [Fusarium mangiferae]
MATRREILVTFEDKRSIWDRIEAESQEGSKNTNPTMEKFLSRWRENTAASEDMAKLASVGKGQTTPREPEHCHNETVKAPVDVLDANDNMTGCSERPALPGAPWPQRIEERAFIPQYHSPKKLCHMASSVAPACIAEEPRDCRHQSINSSCPGHLGFPTEVPSSNYALQRKENSENLPPSRSIAFQPSAPRYELDNCTQRCEEMSELLPTQPRKRPRLPEEAKARLRKWYCANTQRPYPDGNEMQSFLHETKLEWNQIKRWFAGQRRRKKLGKNERIKKASRNDLGGIEYHTDGAAKTNDIDQTVGKATQAMGAIQPMKLATIHATGRFLGRPRFPIDLPRPTPISLPPISQPIPSSTLPSGIPLGFSEILTPLPKQDSFATGPRGPEHRLTKQYYSAATNLTPDDTGRREASGWSEAKIVVNVPSSIHLPSMADFLQSGRLEAREKLKNEPRIVWTAEADLRRFHYSDKETSPTAGQSDTLLTFL